jgi:hypothetical protein
MGAGFGEPSLFSCWGFLPVLGFIALLLLLAYTCLQAEFSVQPFFSNSKHTLAKTWQALFGIKKTTFEEVE